MKDFACTYLGGLGEMMVNKWPTTNITGIKMEDLGKHQVWSSGNQEIAEVPFTERKFRKT